MNEQRRAAAPILQSIPPGTRVRARVSGMIGIVVGPCDDSMPDNVRVVDEATGAIEVPAIRFLEVLGQPLKLGHPLLEQLVAAQWEQYGPVGELVRRRRLELLEQLGRMQ